MTLDEITGDSQFIEEGVAAFHLVDQSPRPTDVRRESLDVVVIGGGQAGLSVGYHLSRIGARFVILDASERVGDAWRNRWDSLRLFSPAKLDSLDGMRFPAPRSHFPSKDEMANYLETYASYFRLPVRNGMRVEKLFKRGSRYVIHAGSFEFDAGQVVIAMSKYQHVKMPDYAKELSSDIVQLASSEYRNLGQLKPGGVLLVGAANSGADIALEIVKGGHKVWLAGPIAEEVPFRPDSFVGRNLFAPLVLGYVFKYVLTVNTPMGRKARPNALAKAVPLIRVKNRDLAAAGVERVPRVVGTRDGLPLLQDGQTLAAPNIIWCNGFQPGFEWIDLPIFDTAGEPKHRSGIVDSQPGLYFVGLPFLHSMSSSMIHGVGRDASRIVDEIKLRLGTDALI